MVCKGPSHHFLLDSEENYTYKHIGREAIRVAILHGHIAPEQYSIPHISAVAHGTNLRIVFDYQQYLQKLSPYLAVI